jgi:hypothetical protein
MSANEVPDLFSCRYEALAQTIGVYGKMAAACLWR